MNISTLYTHFCRLSPLLLIVVMISGCSSGSWLIKNPEFSDSGVFMDQVDASILIFSEDNLTDEIMEYIRLTAADSIGKGTLNEMVTAYNHAGLTSARFTDEIIDADYVLRIERFSINWVPTVNAAHPGPNFRVRITASGWKGDREVFRTTHSDYGNLAYIAAEGRRFYIPTEEDKTDLAILKNTLYPAIRSAYGKIWEEFLMAGRRM